jgi:hypothetical protein
MLRALSAIAEDGEIVTFFKRSASWNIAHTCWSRALRIRAVTIVKRHRFDDRASHGRPALALVPRHICSKPRCDRGYASRPLLTPALHSGYHAASAQAILEEYALEAVRRLQRRHATRRFGLCCGVDFAVTEKGVYRRQ